MATTFSGGLELALDLIEVFGSDPRKAVVKHGIPAANSKLWLPFATGTADGKINRGWARSNSIAAGGTLTLDLAGTLTDTEGNTLTFAELQTALFANFNTAGTLNVIQAAANGVTTPFVNGASSGMVVGAALSAEHPGLLLTHAPKGFAVTAGTGDSLSIVNNDGVNAATVMVFLLGRSA